MLRKVWRESESIEFLSPLGLDATEDFHPAAPHLSCHVPRYWPVGKKQMSRNCSQNFGSVPEPAVSVLRVSRG